MRRTDGRGRWKRRTPRIASAIYQSTYDVGAAVSAAAAPRCGDGFDDGGVAGATFGFFHALSLARSLARARRRRRPRLSAKRQKLSGPLVRKSGSSLPPSLSSVYYSLVIACRKGEESVDRILASPLDRLRGIVFV